MDEIAVKITPNGFISLMEDEEEEIVNASSDDYQVVYVREDVFEFIMDLHFSTLSDVKIYKRRLQRLHQQKRKLSKRYRGNEDKLTFHAGYDLGYVLGQIRAMEDVADL